MCCNILHDSHWQLSQVLLFAFHLNFQQNSIRKHKQINLSLAMESIQRFLNILPGRQVNRLGLWGAQQEWGFLATF